MDPFMFVITDFCFDGCFSAKTSLIPTAGGELLLDFLQSLAWLWEVQQGETETKHSSSSLKAYFIHKLRNNNLC